MEFYLRDKNNRNNKTLVNLVTTFRLNNINYIVYSNEVDMDKKMLYIYIGKIGYGDQCLAINKIDEAQQSEVIDVIKSIITNHAKETSFGDFDNIIAEETIVLYDVQKISVDIPALEMLKKYHNKEVMYASLEEEKDNDKVEEEDINDDIDMDKSFILDSKEKDKKETEDKKNKKSKEKIIVIFVLLFILAVIGVTVYLIVNGF